MTIEQLLKERDAKIKKAQSLASDNDGALTDEQQAEFDGLIAEAEKINRQVENLRKIEVEQARTEKLAKAPSVGRQVQPETGILHKPEDSGLVNDPVNRESSTIKIPAKAKRWAGRLQSFKGPDADTSAYKAGMWIAATLCNNGYARRFCSNHGIPVETINYDNNMVEALHQEGVNTQGGYVVFPEYENSIIRLVEEFGLVRRKFRNVPMTSDTKIRPRRTGGLTSYFIGEGDSITSSTKSWDNVKLITKKLAAIGTASNEFVSDAIISVVDDLTMEIAQAFAEKEDVCGFQGDGTSTYGGIYGVVQKLSTINGVDDGGGLVLGAGNAYSEITDQNLQTMIGRLPQYPGIQPEWYCSKAFWAAVMQRLARGAGGATVTEMVTREGSRQPMYAGYPVNWTSGTTAMPVSEGNSQICCLFGDMRMAAMFGDRQGMSLATTTEATVGSTSMFDTDSFAVRGIERFDINVHDVGSSTAAGPVVGLITASG